MVYLPSFILMVLDPCLGLDTTIPRFAVLSVPVYSALLSFQGNQTLSNCFRLFAAS